MLLAACAVDPELDTTVAELINIDDTCPKFGCGQNSPSVNAIDFHDLELTGRYRNDAGYRVVAFFARCTVFGSMMWLADAGNSTLRTCAVPMATYASELPKSPAIRSKGIV